MTLLIHIYILNYSSSCVVVIIRQKKYVPVRRPERVIVRYTFLFLSFSLFIFIYYYIFIPIFFPCILPSIGTYRTIVYHTYIFVSPFCVHRKQQTEGQIVGYMFFYFSRLKP